MSRAVMVRYLIVAVVLAMGAAACGGSGEPASPPATTALAGCPAAAATTAASAVPTTGPRGPEPREPFLTDPDSQAAQQAAADPAVASRIKPLVRTPTAFPVGDWLTDVTAAVRQRADAATASASTAIFMVYAIPHRDAQGGYSLGGLPNAAAYRTFTRQVAAGIGTARAVVILEPDSLGQIDTLDAAGQAERYGLLNDAVGVYGALPGASVYLDGANCGWTPPAVIAERLLRAGVTRARGFAVNVANYYRTAGEVARGDVISALTGGAHFVVDTSRNGQGPATGIQNPWCNPPGRGLGPTPTTDTGNPLADAFVWIKTPGASDGDCGRGDPPAGSWWPQQAETLVRNAA